MLPSIGPCADRETVGANANTQVATNHETEPTRDHRLLFNVATFGERLDICPDPGGGGWSYATAIVLVEPVVPHPSLPSHDMATTFEIVLFDLGGVIIDLSGLERFLHRHALPADEFWPRWLGLGAGQDFERGLTSPPEFADAFLREFDLAITSEQFLQEFAAWPSGLLPGAAELVTDVPLATATMSNTNAVHWATELEASLVGELFDQHFLSFQLGVAKPSPRIYERVTQLLGVAPETICFVDDNALNVAAAKDAGWTATQVAGPAGARSALTALGVLA